VTQQRQQAEALDHVTGAKIRSVNQCTFNHGVKQTRFNPVVAILISIPSYPQVVQTRFFSLRFDKSDKGGEASRSSPYADRINSIAW
jgi:hypothetical protein